MGQAHYAYASRVSGQGGRPGLSIRLGEEDTERVISHLENAEKEIGAVRKILLRRFEIKNKEPPAPKVPSASDNGTILADLDVSGIEFKQKAGAIAGPSASWGWAFSVSREGEYLDESQELVQAIEQYGKVKVGNRIYTLGGRDGNLLNFKEADADAKNPPYWPWQTGTTLGTHGSRAILHSSREKNLHTACRTLGPSTTGFLRFRHIEGPTFPDRI